MPVVHRVRIRIEPTNVGIELPTTTSTIPTAAIATVGISTASISVSWARRRLMIAGGNRMARTLYRLRREARGFGGLGDVGEDVIGHAVEVPDQADRGEQLEPVVGHVDLVP